MMRKLTAANPDLSFRLALVRNSLLIDSIPTQESVARYSEHILAELEQMGQVMRKKDPSSDGPPKAKKFEAEGKDQAPTKEGEEKERPKCRFYLSEGGCRRGKECRWSHDQKDDKKRCWVCGATDHMSPGCPRKTKQEGHQPPKSKALKGEEGDLGKKKKEDEADKMTSESTMKELVEEANKLLRSMGTSSESVSSASSTTSQEDDGRKDVMEKLQQQLNAMKMKPFKVQINKMTTGTEYGLVDSGATHPLRPRRVEEDYESYYDVEVAIADGRTTRMRMSPGGCMVTERSEVEPIVPMGGLVRALGCKVSWEGEEVKITHPIRGDLPVFQRNGCPQISRKLALSLIEEMEDVNKGVQVKNIT